MKYLIVSLLLAGCSQPFDLSHVKWEVKNGAEKYKVVSKTQGDITEWTLERR